MIEIETKGITLHIPNGVRIVGYKNYVHVFDWVCKILLISLIESAAVAAFWGKCKLKKKYPSVSIEYVVLMTVDLHCMFEISMLVIAH